MDSESKKKKRLVLKGHTFKSLQRPASLLPCLKLSTALSGFRFLFPCGNTVSLFSLDIFNFQA